MVVAEFFKWRIWVFRLNQNSKEAPTHTVSVKTTWGELGLPTQPAIIRETSSFPLGWCQRMPPGGQQFHHCLVEMRPFHLWHQCGEQLWGPLTSACQGGISVGLLVLEAPPSPRINEEFPPPQFTEARWSTRISTLTWQYRGSTFAYISARDMYK